MLRAKVVILKELLGFKLQNWGVSSWSSFKKKGSANRKMQHSSRNLLNEVFPFGAVVLATHFQQLEDGPSHWLPSGLNINIHCACKIMTAKSEL